MSQIHKHDIPANIADRCLISPEQYQEKYQQSVSSPDAFWGEQGHILDWIKPYQKVKNTSFAPGNVSIKWYEDGTLNLAANCLDRHLAERGNETAIIWEGDDASQSKHISYKELHRDVCRFANVLLARAHLLNKLESSEASERLLDEWDQRHQAFHTAIVAGCGSQYLLQMRERLFDLAARYRFIWLRTTVLSVEMLEDKHVQHQTLLEAILARDAERASALMREHLLTPIPIIQQAMAGKLQTQQT